MECRMQTETKSPARCATVLLLALMLALAVPAVDAVAAAREATAVQVLSGQSLVLEMTYDVSTVSIANPDVADAAVGSERTVVVNGKNPGITSLVVWEEGGRHTVYTVTTVTSASAPQQVLLECQVAEVLEDRMKELGFDWVGKGSGKMVRGSLEGGLFPTKVFTPTGYPPVVGPETDGFLKYERENGMFSLATTFRALEEAGVARILASPNLLAASGDSASMLAGGEFPVPVTRSVQEGGVSVSIEWKEYGVRLMFRPTVLDSNRIRLTVSPEVSSLDYSRGVSLGGFEIPGVVTRKTTTTVELGDQDVLVIGGLKQTEYLKRTQKVPILGDIPLVRLLFRHTRTDKVTRDLVIAVSPKLVREAMSGFPAMPGGDAKN